MRTAADLSEQNCRLCPRACGVDRRSVPGYCGQTASLKIARAALHMWEEPCISGTSGSGAIFFTGCPLRCVFCQNYHVAHSSLGRELSQEELAEEMLRLQAEGANNINLVTPDHYIPQLIAVLQRAKDRGLTIPIVYNTGSYVRAEAIRSLEGLVDVYLPDLKYYSPELSARYSNAPDYFAVASEAIREMVRQTGAPVFYRKETAKTGRIGSDIFSGPDRFSSGEKGRFYTAAEYNELTEPEGEAEEFMSEPTQEAAGPADPPTEYLIARGTIVRHLLLPGQQEDSKAVLSYLLREYGEKIYISIMNQYTPLATLPAAFPELNRRVSDEAYEEIIDFVIEQGIENGFIQDGETALESFIPEFHGE